MSHREYISPVLAVPNNEDDYNKLVDDLDSVLDAGGADENHPLAVLAERMAELVTVYENQYHVCHPYQATCIVILDNASMHRSKAFKAEWDNWAAQGVLIHYSPPYSPELNLIEILWRKIKYSRLPLSAYKSVDRLKTELSAVLKEVGRKYRITFS